MLLLCSCQKQGEIETTTATTTTPEVVTVTTTEKTTIEETTTATTTDEETTTTAPVETENPMIPASYGEWFLNTEPTWPSDGEPPVVQVSPEYQNYKLTTPGQYTTTIGQLTFTVDFFKEEYQFGQVLQARVTVHNNSAEEFAFVRKQIRCYAEGEGGRRSTLTRFT